MPEKFYTKRAASEYITSLGFQIAVRTLSKMITCGGGPKYQKFGNRRVVYSQTSLDEWINSRLSQQYNSSNEEA